MKYFKLITVFFVLITVIFSCVPQKKVAKNNAYNRSYVEYLSSVINDTAFYEFKEYAVIDKNIYPILDSAISLSEKCRDFDKKIRYLHSFRFRIMGENDKSPYTIDANLSPAQAISLVLIERGIRPDMGIFYYKNYLFVVPSSKVGEGDKLTFFPFVKKTENVMRIRAPWLFDKNVYSSYLTFNKQDNTYKIEKNEICGNDVTIR